MTKATLAAAVSAAMVALLPNGALAEGSVASVGTTPLPADPAISPQRDADPPKPFESSLAPKYDEPDQLLLPGNAAHGGYGGPELKITTMTGDAAVLLGGQGGWIINHGFVIGGAGYGLATPLDAPAAFSVPNTRSTLQFGYGGPRIAYVFRPHDVVHATVALLVGAGGYTILSRNDGTNESSTHNGRSFFVTEPQAELEANVLRWLRAGFSISYRYVGTRSVPGLETSDLSGLAGSILVKVGMF